MKWYDGQELPISYIMDALGTLEMEELDQYLAEIKEQINELEFTKEEKKFFKEIAILIEEQEKTNDHSY